MASTTIQRLFDLRNEAQRAVEIFLCENYPIDTQQKVDQLKILARQAADAEYQLRRHFGIPESNATAQNE